MIYELPSSYVCVSWSGGKDSTAAILKNLELGRTTRAVCYIPMFDEQTPLLLRDHFNFIMYAKKKFGCMGVEINIVHGITYCEYVRKIATRGKFKGLMFGFPVVGKGQCGFKRDSKLVALANDPFMKNASWVDVGIASDETDRHSQLNDYKRSVLCECGISESSAKRLCERYNLLSPLYTDLRGRRDGCVLCCNAKTWERDLWFSENPDAYFKLIDLQNEVKINRPDRPPLRNYSWFI